MATEEPPSLTVGTEVSAKYRGAFCEAKVKKVAKIVKCKVTIKDSNLPLVVLDEDLKGSLKVGATVEVKLPESGEYTTAVLQRINDMSIYTVVFNDGDENTLRRSQLCLKGEKHFVKSDTLDELPLTNPEHFGTPVVKTMNVSKRKHAAVGSDQDSDDDSSEDSLPCKRMYRGRLQDLIGRVLCIELEDRKGTTWVPVLVVQSSADDAELESKDHLLVKSFRDSKFYTVTKKLSREFTRDMALKNEDKAIKPAFEKALLYYDTRLLPQGWDREELLGSDTEEGEDADESSDNEPNEEKDHFVAQLYKFMDDRGTPINKAPVIASKDLNLYRLFRVVQNLGGYNRVTNQMKWRIVYSRMNLTPSSAASNQIKIAYKKYLHAFEDFYRKLGSTMGTISRPGGRGRHSSSGRSLMSIRDRESTPRSPRASKKTSQEDVREKKDGKAGSPVQMDASAEKTTEKDASKSDSRTKSKPSAAASESHIKDATSGATARESRSEGRPETRASFEDRDTPRAKGETRGREGVRKAESLSTNLSDSPRRRVSRFMTEHRKVAAREAKEKEVKRELPDDSSTAEEGRKELRAESLRRRREEEGKETREEGRRGRPQNDGKREDAGKKDDAKEETRTDAKLGSPSQRGKQEEGNKRESREDARRGKQQELREEASKAGGKEEEKKGAAEKRGQKEDQEKEEVSDSEEKDGGKQKKRVTRKKVKEEVGLEEEGKTEKKTKETKTEKPKEVKNDKPKETKSEKLKEAKADKVKEVKSEKPKEVKAEKPKEVKVEKAKEVKSEKLKEVKLEKMEKLRDERSENSDDSGDSKDIKDDKRQEGEYPIGTKLKVKYGRGRNQKLYEAKVVEKERESNVLHYRVHYDGWNKRYDEWIRKERIVGVVEELVEPPKKLKPKTPIGKAKVLVKKVVRPLDSQGKAKSPSAVPSPTTPAPGAPSRPTRSNSMEASLSSGLPMKTMRPRSTSGHTEASDPQTHTSESEGEEEEEEEVDEESTLKTEEDKASDGSETNAGPEAVDHVASPAHLPEELEVKEAGSEKEDKDDEEEEEEETVVVEPRTLRRREDMKVTSTPKICPDVSSNRVGKIDTAVTMPKLSLVSPQKDLDVISEVKMKTEDTESDDEKVGENKGAKEAESVVVKDSLSQPEEAPTECPKIEKVDKAVSDDEKVDKKQMKPRMRRREGTRTKAVAKSTSDSSTKAEETAVKSDDVGSDKDVVTLPETEEPPSAEVEEDGGDDEEKREKGRKRTKVTKEKQLEKTPKGKGKQEKAERPKGRPPKSKKLEVTATPSADIEVKVKKRVKRMLVEKTALDEEASSDLSEKEAPVEVPESDVVVDKTETKPRTTGESIDDRDMPSCNITTDDNDTPVETASAAPCASPVRQGSPAPEAPKLWDSVSVDVNTAHEPPSEKAPDLSPVSGAGLQQSKPVTDHPAATTEPDTPPVEAKMLPALKAEASAAIFDNTPPSTPEHTSSATAVPEHVEESSSRDSPNRPDEVYSTKSEYEANLEVAVLMATTGGGRSDMPDVPAQVCESPIACDMSTMSNSSGGSSGNAPGSESEEPPSGSQQKEDDDNGEPTLKRRKRTHKRPLPASSGSASTEKAKHQLSVAPTAKPELSDSDDGADARAEEASSQGSEEKPIAAVSVASPDNRRTARPSKYNFIESLEEGKYLEGEKRIDFLVGKIQEIRKIYMQLKAEVACIDRRRKRHRRRERESNKASGEQQHTPSHMDIECS